MMWALEVLVPRDGIGGQVAFFIRIVQISVDDSAVESLGTP